MPNRDARRLLRHIYGLETRVSDLEQNRPGETPVREVVVVTEGLGLTDSVSVTEKTDFEAKWDQSANGWERTQWADESGGGI
jgi:hypothetical protein